MAHYKSSLLATIFIALLCCSHAHAASVPVDPPKHLRFLAIADLQGQLESSPGSIDIHNSGAKTPVVGGISRIASIIKQIKTQNNHPVIVVSSGDDLMGRYFNTFQGKAITSLCETAGYDIYALGNHEFDQGPGVLGEALEQTKLATLCSDLNIAGTALEGTCLQFFIKEYDTIRVGFFSLMTPQFSYITHAGNVSIKENHISFAKKMIHLLQLKKVDLIVAVTHIGIDLDQKLAAEVDGIDIIIGGHSHDYLPQALTINNTLIVNGGEKGTALARLDVSFDTNKQLVPSTATYTLIPVLESTPEDSVTAKKLHYFQNQLPSTVVLGHTDKAWPLDKHTLRSGESIVADMVNDLIRKRFQVDIVLNNSGAFRGKKLYPAGIVTDTMLHEIDEFSNDIYLLKIKGKYLLELLEHSAAAIGKGGFLQIAGARIRILTTAAAQEIIKQNGHWEISRPGQRITTLQIRNSDGSFSPVTLEKTYSVATNAFLAKAGGDKFFWFNRYGQEKANTHTSLYSIMALEIRHHKNLTPPEPDGRILLVTEQ